MQPNRTPPPELAKVDAEIKEITEALETNGDPDGHLRRQRAKLFEEKTRIMNAWRFRLASEGAC